MQLITVVGARPQFIKAAVLSRTIDATHAGPKAIQEKILHTGQYYDAAMTVQFLWSWGSWSQLFNWASVVVAMGLTPAEC